jgi:hypothetical protein
MDESEQEHARRTDQITVTRGTGGRIAERIVANELEVRGFHVTSLNKDGQLGNADLLAAGHGKVWQVQVKGARHRPKHRWWIQYGYCTLEIARGNGSVFNRHDSFYRADIVVLVAWRSPKDYKCIVLRTEDAERAAQLSLDCDYRRPKRNGEERRPSSMIYATLESTPRHNQLPPDIRMKLDEQREILSRHEDAWKILVQGTEPDSQLPLESQRESETTTFISDHTGGMGA